MRCVGILTYNYEIKIFIDHSWYFTIRTIIGLILSFRPGNILWKCLYILSKKMAMKVYYRMFNVSCQFKNWLYFFVRFSILWYVVLIQLVILYIRTYTDSLVLYLKKRFNSIYQTLHVSKTNSGIVWMYFLHTYYTYSKHRF